MSRTFHSRKLRTKKANGRGAMAYVRAARQGWQCRCWYCIGSKAYDRKNNPPMPDPYELEGLQDELANPGFYSFLYQIYGTDEDLEDGIFGCCPLGGRYCWSCTENEPTCPVLMANIQEHVAYQWAGRPLPFARQHRNNWRRHLTRRFLASRYFRSERHTKLFQDFIMNLTRKPLTRR